MQGDPLVDRLMMPVVAALMRHGIKGDAKTDIYNRAYEAVMNSMVVMDTMREQLSEANRRANGMSAIDWEYEDKLPDMPKEVYDAMFECSKVDVVRLFPYVIHGDKRAFLVRLQEPDID